MQHLEARGIGQQGGQRVGVADRQRVDQVHLGAGIQLQERDLGVEGVAAHELRIHRQVGGCRQGRERRRQRRIAVDKTVAHVWRTGCRPLKACASVDPSTYSSSPPSGTPWAMRLTRLTSGCSSWVM